MKTLLAITMVLFGSACRDATTGDACTSAGGACGVSANTCDLTFDGGYCTRSCTTAGTPCDVSGDQYDGVCGLPLADGGLGCASQCGAGMAGCRAGLRCTPVAAPAMCSSRFACTATAICIP